MNDSFALSSGWDLSWPNKSEEHAVKFLYFNQGKLIGDPELRWSEQLLAGDENPGDCIYVAKINDQIWYCREVSDAEVPKHWQATGLRELAAIDQNVFSLASRATQLLRWKENHRYCGHCGNVTVSGQNEHVLTCPSCSALYYPKLTPCVIVLIYKDNNLLLARNIRHKDSPMYSLIAGFIEVGESIEQAVHREVEEEVGVSITKVEYQASQTWPFPSQLMLGFFAEYKAGEINIQEDEILEADWFPSSNLPEIPPKLSIAGWLIDKFIKIQQEK